MSFFIISDSGIFSIWYCSRSQKVFEGDKVNTGGMGAYSPSRLEDEKLNQKF